MKKLMCESCLMPLGNNLEDAGTEKDGSKNGKYCKYCYVEGGLQYKGNDLKEFKSVAYKHMRDRGVNFFLANLYTYMINYAPRWKK